MNLQDRYVNPFTDFGFKKLFGSEPNKEFLIDFLNTLLPENHRIEDLTYTKSEHLGGSPLDRKAIFDLYCTGKDGSKFIVEVQKAKQNFFKDRSIYYSTFPIQEQAKRGDWDFKLAHVYTVGILDFEFQDGQSSENVKTVVKLKDAKGEVFYDKLTFIYLEMPKFDKTEEQLESNYDKWLYVFKHLPYLQNRPRKLQERIFEKFFRLAEIANFTPEERENYEDSLKYYRDLKNVVDTSFVEGKAEGKAEGKEERAIEIARNILGKGLDISLISELTGLSQEEIEKLKK
ncbi:MAG: Rpn family recombination-promoting nuclease/putative transposase [Chitinophagales bacterium]|nr:PD-(D/E)XK nuclease family transposase [Bacteroidota bacterium]MCB9043053.1 PD-(D/E)XK nuclease family transposase [Chitinophagales bacterium]